MAAVWFLVLGLAGCDNLQEITTELEGKSEATYWFWVRLQGIQYRGNKEILNTGKANVAAAKASDVDGTADGFKTISEKHADLVRQLTALDASDVDESAIDYRNRLVDAHQALSEEYKIHATATESRDMQQLVQRRESLRSLTTEYVGLWNERTSVMSQLKEKYDRGFDYME